MTEDNIYTKECVIEILYRIDDVINEFVFLDEECEKKSGEIVKKYMKDIDRYKFRI